MTLLLSVVTGVTDFLYGFSVTLLPLIVTDVTGFLRVVTNLSLILSVISIGSFFISVFSLVCLMSSRIQSKSPGLGRFLPAFCFLSAALKADMFGVGFCLISMLSRAMA